MTLSMTEPDPRDAPWVARDLLEFRADPVQRGIVEALSRADEWHNAGAFLRGLTVNVDSHRVTVGLEDGYDRGLSRDLSQRRLDLVRLHLALLDRWHAGDGGGGPAGWVTLTRKELCVRTGRAPHAGGSPSESARLHLARDLAVLASLSVVVTGPGALNGHGDGIRRPAWRLQFPSAGWRGPSARSTEPAHWVNARGFMIRSEAEVDRCAGRQLRVPIGRAPAGLIRLSGRADSWAGMIGARLACLGAADGYAPRRLAVGGLLERAGLGETRFVREHPDRIDDRLREALNGLRYLGLIGDWRVLSSPAEHSGLAPDAWKTRMLELKYADWLWSEEMGATKGRERDEPERKAG